MPIRTNPSQHNVQVLAIAENGSPRAYSITTQEFAGIMALQISPPMPTTDQQRHQMIERAVRRSRDAQTDVNVELWDSLAAELSVLIGERGFRSLYIRSLYCASAAFPWMVRPIPQVSLDAFKVVEFRLSTSDAAQAQAAHAALLNIYTDTLILLIGEALTNSILRKAWGDDVVDDAGTES